MLHVNVPDALVSFITLCVKVPDAYYLDLRVKVPALRVKVPAMPVKVQKMYFNLA